jgi:hypothetical protein
VTTSLLFNADGQLVFQETTPGNREWGVRFGEAGVDSCCLRWWIQARKCSDGSLAEGIWLELIVQSGVQGVMDGLEFEPFPFYFTLDADVGQVLYYVDAGSPVTCVPQDSPGAFTERESCAHCPRCNDSTPLKYTLGLADIEVDLTESGIWVNDPCGLGGTGFQLSFDLDDAGFLADPYCLCWDGFCSWTTRTDVTGNVNVSNVYNCHGGDGYLSAYLVACLQRTDATHFTLSVGLELNFSNNDPYTIEIFSGTVEVATCNNSGDDINLDNDYTDFTFPQDLLNEASRIGGKNGTATVQAGTEYCAHLPKYSLTIAGTHGGCDGSNQKGDGDVDVIMDDDGGGTHDGLDISTTYDMPSPPSPATIKGYSAADCTGIVVSSDDYDLKVTISMSALGSGVAEVTITDPTGVKGIWHGRADYTTADRLYCGYPARITLPYADLSGFALPFTGGTATLEMINAVPC